MTQMVAALCAGWLRCSNNFRSHRSPAILAVNRRSKTDFPCNVVANLGVTAVIVLGFLFRDLGASFALKQNLPLDFSQCRIIQHRTPPSNRLSTGADCAVS